MRNPKTLSLTVTGLMTAVLCVLGPLSLMIPVSPVPISLTNFAVCLAVVILGMRRGALSTLVYLLIGFIGVPVFSAFTGGPGKLLGPTGGYLIGFLALALIAGYFVDRNPSRPALGILGMVLGTLVLYAMGTAWLAYVAGMTFGQALMAGVVPFIPGDAVKIILAALVGYPVRRRLRLPGAVPPETAPRTAS
jgi:biotin transport system substrate-specific component